MSWEEDLGYKEMAERRKIKIAKNEKSWVATRNGQTTAGTWELENF